jgi:hypothetical protein
MRLFAVTAMNRAVTRVDFALDRMIAYRLNPAGTLAIGRRFAAKSGDVGEWLKPTVC